MLNTFVVAKETVVIRVSLPIVVDFFPLSFNVFFIVEQENEAMHNHKSTSVIYYLELRINPNHIQTDIY